MTAPAVNAAATNPHFEFGPLRLATNYRAALVKDLAPWVRGRVLEVGAGIGQMSGEFARLPTVTEFVAFEPDPRFHASFALANPGIRLIAGTGNSPETDSPWDTVLAINVLEHIEQDHAAVAEWFEWLKSTRGHLALFVPARPELYSPIDRDFGHFRRYTRTELSRLLGNAGFEIQFLHYFNWVGYFAWAINFRLLRLRRFSPSQVFLFDRFLFPAIHALERHVARPPFGQSLIAVARAGR